MAEHSTIEWTDATWNPITGCTMVSAGCTNCYAMGLAATRLRNHPSRAGLTRETGGRAVWTGEVRLNEQWLDQPLRWKLPRKIFVCAHGDLFHEGVPDEWIDRVFAVMVLAPWHTFQVLTKRPKRARVYLQNVTLGRWNEACAGLPPVSAQAALFPLPNVWLGTSIEDQATANDRIPHLLATPAAIRFISAEPLLGQIDLTDLRPANCPFPGDPNALTGRCVWPTAKGFEDSINATAGYVAKLDWVIVGGESGHNARPMDPRWARHLRDQCINAGVAFHFKQWGEFRPPETVEERALFREGKGVGGSLMMNGTFGNPYGGGVIKVGKKAAGRLLDGLTWDEVPG